MEPFEKMKVNIQKIIFGEGEGDIVEPKAHESLTLIANEHLTQQNRGSDSSEERLPVARTYYQFKIRFTSPDSMRLVIFTVWNIQIKKFVYFANTGNRIKLLPMPEFYKGMISVDFLNPTDAQLFWYYASKNRYRREVPN